jgi:uncharacterized tellurite resistance protein B-like protein
MDGKSAMRDETLIMTLAKVLIASAWADGELTNDETNCVKDLMFNLPEVSATQWAQLDIYMDSPVGEAERARLIGELEEAVSTEQGRQLALTMLDEMVQADGSVSPQEQEVVNEVKAALVSADVGLGGALSRFMLGVTAKRTSALSTAPNREDYFDDYVNNRIYYRIQQREQEQGETLDIPEEKLRKLSLAGGVMAQVAQANPQVTSGEHAVMVGALQKHWNLSHGEAAFVAEVALSEPATQLDRYRLAREFSDTCSHEEAVQFLDVLFAIATADGQASVPEIEEIRKIAGSLKLFHNEFIDAKLRVPKELRAG